MEYQITVSITSTIQNSISCCIKFTTNPRNVNTQLLLPTITEPRTPRPTHRAVPLRWLFRIWRRFQHITPLKGKGNLYSITERRVPEMIPVVGSQPAGDVSHKPGGRLPLLSAMTAVRLPSLPISLLDKQTHDGCEQFAEDCYPTVSRLRFEPWTFCAWVQHANHSATEPSIAGLIYTQNYTQYA